MNLQRNFIIQQFKDCKPFNAYKYRYFSYSMIKTYATLYSVKYVFNVVT